LSPEEEQKRDRELENLLGQFLVASFQSDKLAEMISDRLPFSSSKEVKIVLPQRGASRHPMLMTVRVEPYAGPSQAKRDEESEGPVKAMCVLESPGLELGPALTRERIQEIVESSMRWWMQQGIYGDLKLERWKVNVSMIDNRDSRRVSQIYTLLGNLEAKRKGEMTR
jgi:hypothetical protein